MREDTTTGPNHGEDVSPPQGILVRALLDQGIAAAKHGQYERARRKFEAVLDIDVNNEEAWLGLASLTRDRDLARAIYQRVLDVHPDSVRARVSLRWLDEATLNIQPFVSTEEDKSVFEPESHQSAERSEAEKPQEPPSLSEAEGPALFIPPWEVGATIPIMESPPFGSPFYGSSPVVLAAQETSSGSPDQAEAPSAKPTEGEAAISPLPDAATGSESEAQLPAPVSEAVATLCPEEPPPSEATAELTSPTEGESQPPREISITEEPALATMTPEMQPIELQSAHQPSIEPSSSTKSLGEGYREYAVEISRGHTWRDVVMLCLLGLVLLGASGLAFLVADDSKADKVRIALGAMTLTPTPTLTPTCTSTPTSTSTSTPTQTPTITLTPSPTGTFTPSPTLTPSWITARFLPLPTDEKWIEVDLSEQKLTAYEGTKVVFSTKISSGRSRTPTITGKFRIQRKYESQLMSGPGYYLPNVPYVMYFYGSFALHGAYWHNNWGTPMSHGCVNLRKEDAKWLYEWAGPVVPANAKSVMATRENPGTWVIIHQ